MSRLENRVSVRSYRGVVDQVERRIYKFDRWRLPAPHGLSVRALTYTIGAFVVVLIAAKLPLVSVALGVLPPSIRLIALPVGAGWALASWAPDGRAPHHALISALRHLRAPKHLSGLRRCPPIGAELLGVAEIQVAPSGDEPDFRSGVVKGPARVGLRYPAEVSLEGIPRRARGEGAELASEAKRLIVRPLEQARGPLGRGRVISVPAGKQMRFEEGS